MILIHKVIDEHTRYIVLSVRFNMRLHSREQKEQKGGITSFDVIM